MPIECRGVLRPTERRRVLGLSVALLALAFCGLYLRSTSTWWFEDDPHHYAAAAAVDNPVDIFLDPNVLHRWGTGASLVPMHVLSFWIDTHAFGVSPRAARIHQLVSTVVVAFLIAFVLRRFDVEPLVAAAAALLWLCLPATLAVHYYLGTRQYMEGLGWSLLAADQLRLLCGQARPRTSTATLFLVCAAAAMLSKETYAAAVPAFVFLYALAHRRFGWSAVAVALAAGYAGYRIAILGAGADYPHPPWSLEEYLRYLRVLPDTLAVGPRGWILAAGLAALAVAALRKPSGWRPVVLFIGVLAAGLAATYPTAPAVLLTHETPGTWYRAVFAIQTTVLLAGAYLLGRFASRATRAVALAVFLAVVVPGTVKTRRYWLDRLAGSEAEGRFYLAHPDRLVYSEEPAYWFLPGLDKLYGVATPHSIGRFDPELARATEMLRRHATIWRRRDGAWAEDPGLYASLRAKASPEAP